MPLHLCDTVLAAAFPFHRAADEPDLGWSWPRQFHGQPARWPRIGCHRIRQVDDARGGAPNGSDVADLGFPTVEMVKRTLHHRLADERLVHRPAA